MRGGQRPERRADRSSVERRLCPRSAERPHRNNPPPMNGGAFSGTATSIPTILRPAMLCAIATGIPILGHGLRSTLRCALHERPLGAGAHWGSGYRLLKSQSPVPCRSARIADCHDPPLAPRPAVLGSKHRDGALRSRCLLNGRTERDRPVAGPQTLAVAPISAPSVNFDMMRGRRPFRQRALPRGRPVRPARAASVLPPGPAPWRPSMLA